MTRWWVIRDKDGTLLPWSSAVTRKDAWIHFESSFGLMPGTGRDGCKAVRVTVTENA